MSTLRHRVLAGLLLVLATACTRPPPPAANTGPAPAPATAPPPPTAPAGDGSTPDVQVRDAERACTADAECTLITADCCGCDGLGRQVGVRKDAIVAVAERRRPICGSIACAQALSDDPSCTANEAVCRGGVCTPDVPADRPASPGRAGQGVEPIP